MALETAQADTQQPAIAQPSTAPQTQSVYVQDAGVVKNYPKTATPDEISYDAQTDVRGKTPEDFFTNLSPFGQLQRAFEGAKLYAQYAQPAFKMAVTRPDVMLGFSPASSVTPDEIAQTYKPWHDLWRNSYFGKAPDEMYGKLAADHPVAGFVPWFVSEFVPGELLDFGTKAENWVGAYGIQRFGPPIINKVLEKLPDPVRKTLLTELWRSEEGLVDAFKTLGVPPNSKTSAVTSAFRDQAMAVHPDRGGTSEQFVAVRDAYNQIMQSRGGALNKLFDVFRGMPDAASESFRPNGTSGLLGFSERGGALIPFNEGDLVNIGSKVAQVTKISGAIATVNLAGKLVDMPIDKLTPHPLGEPGVNPEHIKSSEDAKAQLVKATDVVRNELQKFSDKPISHAEVTSKAQEADILTAGASRESTLTFEAALLRTRQHLAALAEQPTLTPEFIDTLRIVANTGTDIARQLESFKIDALPEYASLKMKVVRDILKLGKSSEEVLKASQGVDFKNQQQVAQFYRTFVKPKLSDILNEFAYINILSSPKTHIVNTFSNILQLTGLNPLTKLASGSVDMVGSSLSGAERRHYLSEIPAFYKGALNAVPQALGRAAAVMQGKQFVERPDIKHIPTLSPFINYATLGLGKYITRALEASDVLFQSMIYTGEVEALSAKHVAPIADKAMLAIQKEAQRRAQYYVFRQKPDTTNANGQGDLLTAIDKMTQAVYRFRDVPGVKWFVRFVQTPMNILKQGIEFSPAGFATLKGNTDKTEQMGKAMIGSVVAATGAYYAGLGYMTWALPRSERDKQLFYAAGRQPYSIKVGNTWLSYSKLGPLAYPLAMAAALVYHEKESPDALADNQMEKLSKVLGGVLTFFSDQSYLQGIGDLVKTLQGDQTAIASFATSAPTQMIPLSSLQGWVNSLVDPFYRKKATGLNPEALIDNLKSKLVGGTLSITAKKDISGQPAKKGAAQIVNPISPVNMSEAKPAMDEVFKATQAGQRQVKKAKRMAADALRQAERLSGK